MKTKDKILYLLAFFTFFATSFGANLVVNITALLPFGKYSWAFVSVLETIVLSSVWWWGKSHQIKNNQTVLQPEFVFKTETESPVIVHFPAAYPASFSEGTAWIKREEIAVISDYLQSIQSFMQEKMDEVAPMEQSKKRDQLCLKELDQSLERISSMTDELFKYKALALNASLESNFKTSSEGPYKKLSKALAETTEALMVQISGIQKSLVETKNELEKSMNQSSISEELSEIEFLKLRLKDLERWTVISHRDDSKNSIPKVFAIKRHEAILKNINSLLVFLNKRLGDQKVEGGEVPSTLKNVA